MLSALDNCALQETTDASEFALPKKLGVWKCWALWLLNSIVENMFLLQNIGARKDCALNMNMKSDFQEGYFFEKG